MNFKRNALMILAATLISLLSVISTANAKPIQYSSWLTSGVTVSNAFSSVNEAGLGADYYSFRVDSTLVPGQAGYSPWGFQFRVVALNDLGIGREAAISAPLYITRGLFSDTTDLPTYASVLQTAWTGGNQWLLMGAVQQEVGDYTFAVSWKDPGFVGNVNLGYELTMTNIGTPPQTIPSVPEPTSHELLLAGMLAIGVTLRNRRKILKGCFAPNPAESRLLGLF